ncbi:hypothetical protein [Spongiactinospora rosea]|uniref:hypothetical protein n=1 Tax=Spongiactinospora rosea TaxID=2248750 RepID=UPI0011C01B2C|nr:hypothetical protein [Spongiactinospora rosea]
MSIPFLATALAVGCTFTPARHARSSEPTQSSQEHEIRRAEPDQRYIGRGPLKSSKPTGYILRRNPGVTFTDGWNHFLNFGDEPITILKVEPVFTGIGLHHLGTLIAGHKRRWALQQALKGYPPVTAGLGPLAPAENFVIPAEGGRPLKKGWQLLMGIHVVQNTGRSTRTHIKVTYRYKGHVISDEWINTIAVCTPEKGPECQGEYAGTNDGE